jgi:DNA-binding protein HU-beta
LVLLYHTSIKYYLLFHLNSAGRVLDSIINTVAEELASGGEVALVGFGTYKVNYRAARTGRNPQTGEEIYITAAKVPVFKTGKVLKDAVNG